MQLLQKAAKTYGMFNWLYSRIRMNAMKSSKYYHTRDLQQYYCQGIPILDTINWTDLWPKEETINSQNELFDKKNT